jgi:tripartite ATP-independent transporter DctM subunit
MEGFVLLGLFLVLAGLGLPIAFAMGVSSIATLTILGVPYTAYFARSIAGIDAFSLLAIPFFVFVGELLTGGGMSRRIIDFANSLIGWLRGGLGVVNVGGSVLFGGISGSSAADTAAIGGVLIPEMKRSGYDPGFAAAVTASSATIGSLIPPSVLLIIYGGISGLSIGSLFLAGVVPGLLVGGALFIITWWIGRKQVGQAVPFSLRNVFVTSRRAALTGLLPVLLVFGILQGVVTATEGGVIGVIYALFIGGFVYRELSLRSVVDMAVRSAEFTGILLVLLGTATVFAWTLAYLGIPKQILLLLTGAFASSNVIILVIIGFLLVFGMFVETVSAATIVVPVLLPIGPALGLDPLHFGMIIVVTLLVGTVTPPVGVLLYICAGLADISISRAVRSSLPFLVVLVACVIAVAFVPAISLWLPSLAQ